MGLQLLVLIALLIGYETAAGRPDPSAVDPYIFRILTRHGEDKRAVSGTGFAIQGASALVTNYHVIDGAKGIMVLASGLEGTVLPARVLHANKLYDIAVLSVTGLSDSGLLLSPREEAMKGLSVWAIGYPGAADRGRVDLNSTEATLTQGIVNRTLYQPWEEGGPILALVQHDAKLSHGNSGGPLLDACGQVVGVNTRIELAEQALETYDYALAVAELRGLLDSWGIAYRKAPAPCAADAEPQQEPLVWWIVGLTVMLATIALTLALRSPRQRLVQMITSYHRPLNPYRPKGKHSKANARLTETTLTLQRGAEVLCVLRCAVDQSREWVIGRSATQCDYVIDEDAVSRRHIRVLWKAQRAQWYVEDLHSSNGTCVDGKNLAAFEPTLLRQGSRLTLGELQLAVACENQAFS